VAAGGLASVAVGVDDRGGGKVLVRALRRSLYMGRSSSGWGAMTCSRCRAGFGDNP
jgi:hypothetical protein